jgi:hypothetical protein
MDLALKDAHLVAEYDQFEVLVHVATVARYHKSQEPAEPQVNEGEDHVRS